MAEKKELLKDPLVSIIIPCKELDDLARECVEHCRNLDYPNFEILLLPDVEDEGLDGVRIIATGALPPGAKRNVGVMNSECEFCAFIDSDAYPRDDWLKNAVKYLIDPEVGAVGGPGLTPENAAFMERASGYVLSSFMVGQLSSRYDSKSCFESDDIHSCNFVVKKAVLTEVGGWNEKYWPGEDTLVCLAIRNFGKKLVEASDVVVYHHRRPLLVPHLKQASRFGLHRGFFAKRFQGNSLKLTYFVPSLFVLSLFAGVVASFINAFFLNVLLLAVAAYLILGLIAAFLEVKEIKLLPSVWLGIIATHVVYGVSFLMGLMKSNLER
jgi:cellulose synthase/poly-beta-1,6-N-acetylglucosamine synthase-like glycosyltransferase